jgi:hypothetical protein
MNYNLIGFIILLLITLNTQRVRNMKEQIIAVGSSVSVPRIILNCFLFTKKQLYLPTKP